MAKNIEVSYEVQENKISADNKVVWANNLIGSGSGTLEVLGLTTDEKCLLFGKENVAGGFGMDGAVSMPQFAIMFQQEKADGGKILHVLYNCSFAPAGINATSLEEGQIEEKTESLEFTSIQGANGYYFFSLDTKDAKADKQAITKWFTEVQDIAQLKLAATTASAIEEDK